MFYKKTIARIIKIKKDDMTICSSRVIWADLEDNNGQKFHVAWADTPSVIGVTGNWATRNKMAFSFAWKCEEGDEVYLFHSDDQSHNYFEPM